MKRPELPPNYDVVPDDQTGLLVQVPSEYMHDQTGVRCADAQWGQPFTTRAAAIRYAWSHFETYEPAWFAWIMQHTEDAS